MTTYKTFAKDMFDKAQHDGKVKNECPFRKKKTKKTAEEKKSGQKEACDVRFDVDD